MPNKAIFYFLKLFLLTIFKRFNLQATEFRSRWPSRRRAFCKNKKQNLLISRRFSLAV